MFIKESGFALIFFAGLIILPLAIFLILNGGASLKNTPIEPKPLPMPSDTTKNYSNINRLVPGKSTFDDVIKINGKPESYSTFGNKTYLYYPTPLGGYRNVVLLENKKVLYAEERVFGPYRGTLVDFQNRYNGSFVKMYQEGEPFTWYVYLDRGLGIKSDLQGTIGAIVYFVPMSKKEFIKNVATDLGITEELREISE